MSNSKSRNPFFNVLAAVFALLVMPIYEYGKKISKHVYKGWQGIVAGISGVGVATVASYFTAKYLGWDLEINVFFWLLGTLAAWPLTFFVVWPTFYQITFKQLFNFLEWLFDHTEEFAKKGGKRFISGLVNCVKVVPGASSLWSYVENKEKGYQWVIGLATFLGGVTYVAFAGYVAYITYSYVLPFVTFTNPYYLSEIAAGFVAALPALVVAVIPIQLLSHNNLHFSAVTLSGLATALLYPTTSYLVQSLGLPAAAAYGAPVASFFLLLGFGYPMVHGVLKSGLFAELLKGFKYLAEETYDEDNKDFAKLYAHVVNILASLALGAAVIILGAPIYPFIPVFAFWAVAAVITLVTYLCLGEFLEDGPSSVFTSLAATGAAGWGFHWLFADSLSTLALWSSIVGCVLATFFVVFPVLYMALRFITTWLHKPAGGALAATHESATKLAKKVTRWWDDNVYEKTYEDRSDYRGLFDHLSNLSLLALGVWQAIPLTTGWLGWPFWLSAVILVVAGYLCYLIVGKIITSIGPGALGGGLSLVAGSYVGYNLYGFDSGYWWLAAILGITTFGFAVAVVFPVLYLVVKAPLNLILTPWLKPILEGVYNFMWKRFETIWDRFVAVYKVVHEAIFKPMVLFFASLVAAAKAWWDSFRGRKA